MNSSLITRSPLSGPQALGLLFAVLWSSAWIAGKIGLEFTGPLTLLEIRFSAAALVMLLIVLLTAAPWPRRWADYGHLAVAGLLINGLTMASLYTGLSDGVSAGVSALIAGLTPLLTALVAGPVLGERLGAGRWFGLAIGFLGVAMVVMNKISTASGSWEGYAVTFVALAAFVVGTLYQKRFCSAMDLRTGNLIQFAVAGVALFLPAMWLEGLRVEWSQALVISSAWLALVNSIAAISLLYFLLRRGEASRVATLFYLTPPITAALSFIVLHESLGAVALTGFALTAAGVYLGSGRGYR
ncbi:MAG TPA: DMT family transporter [Burkholderiales bacterium]|nr:DMT family transporter [Burkholderiales bacterium]